MDWARLGQTLVSQQYRPSSLEERLLRADVVRAAPVRNTTANAGSSETTAVILGDGGGVIAAYHKPLDGIDSRQVARYGHDAHGALVNESAAWLMAKMLGPPYRDMVPDVVIRSIWPTASGTMGFVGGFGALSIEAPGDTNVSAPLHDPVHCDPAAFFDALIGQQDRHSTNYRWQSGPGGHPGRLGLLDNAYSFAAPDPRYLPWASEFVGQRHNAGRANLDQLELDLLSQVQGVPELWAWLDRMLRPDQAAALRGRIDRMLASRELVAPLEF